MILTGAEAVIVRRETSSRLTTSYGPPPELREHVLVILRAEDGTWGWGEASPLPKFTGETATSIKQMLEERFFPVLQGRLAEPGLIRNRIDSSLPHSSAAKAAVDMALTDLLGKLHNVDGALLLGGACRTSVPITRPIGITSVDEAIEQASSYLEAGHGTIKMKVGSEPAMDVERVGQVRKQLGDDFSIRIDANQGYDFATAHYVLSRLESANIEYCEQPLPAWNHRDLAALRSKAGVRIAVDESLHTLADAHKLIEARAADVFVIKLIKTSGLFNAKRISDLGAEFGITTTVVSPFDTQVGAAHALQLALTLPDNGPACELTVFTTQASMAESRHRVEAGRLYASGDAGCGVTELAELVVKEPSA